jgi:putative hydrolase of HD superfamily
MQHNQGLNPADFDYRFNLGYGRQHTAENPLIAQVREVLDRETEARAREADARPASHSERSEESQSSR